ncbi:MAG: superoxide dismutase [Lachnospiraceae bacterium]|nr:superoxide dismutase [Lachnospiraceae bacterium]
MNEHYRFVNTPLPYPYSAMEPYIDEKTMWLHHSRHLQAYIDNLNNTLSKYPALRNWTLEELIMNTASLPEDIRTAVAHNSGGVFNHQFYFSNLANPAQQQPFGTLNEAIRNRFRNYASFQAQFKEAALSVFGSGYAWLVVNAFGELDIMTTGNQDTPLPLGLSPVLNIDVWEHAYYLKHYNVRADYIDDWFHVVNWNNANKNYMRKTGMAASGSSSLAAPSKPYALHFQTR